MSYGCHSMYKSIKKILLKRPTEAFISQDNLHRSWETFNYVKEPNYNKVLEEYAVFEGIIKDHVEEILFLPKSDKVGLDSIYTHDSVKITKKGAIFFNTGKVLRQKEGKEVEALFNANGIPTLGWINAPGKIEGGDVVWLDDETVAIGLGYRTNMEGIEQFKELTKGFIKNIIVVQMPHAYGEAECLHLMSIISIVDKDLAVVYSKFMPITFRNWLIENGYTLIEVNDQEYDNLGSNVLALGPRICLLMEGNPKIEADLKSHDCTVFTYPGEDVSFLGTGGPTCLTCPIVRE